MDTKGGVFIAIAVTLVIFNVTAVQGQQQGNTTFTLTPLDNSHLTTSFRLDCRFFYADGSSAVIQSAMFFRKRETEPNFSQVAQIEVGDTPISSWNDTALQGRSTLTQIDRPFVRMEVSNIGCNDRAQYRCTYFVRDRNGEYYISGEDKQLVVTAPPRKPEITYTPNVIVEKEPVTLTCSGNVGLPAGTLDIFVVKSDGQVNLNANNGLIEVESNGCTFQRTATASYNFTDTDDSRTSVRCKVQQTYANDADHSVQTGPVSVLYTPRDTEMYRAVDNGNKIVIPPGQSIEVPVQSDVLLECRTRSSPASLYEWSYVLIGTNDNVTENPTSTGILRLDSIAQSKAGNYKCMVTNRINNVTFTDDSSFRLNVSNIPTVPPTETPTDSTATETQPGKSTKAPGPITEPSQAGVIAGAVVGAVVVVIIVIIIVIFIMRRKKDNKERMNEMNSKPRNNQDIPKVVVHPHLVTPDKFDKYNKGFEKNEKELEYADLKFDDTPRSRKPVQILYEPTNYAEVAWPRV